MNKYLYLIPGLIVGALLTFTVTAQALGTPIQIFGGGTGTTTAQSGRIIYGGKTAYQSVATTTASCTGSASCSSFTVIGSTPVSISASGGGGSYPFAVTGNATTTKTQFNGGLTAFASTTIGNGTTRGGLTINGSATTTNLKVTSLTSGNCVQASTGGLLVSAAAACGSGTGGTFPFDPHTNYNSTSTAIGFLKGLFSTASSTFLATTTSPGALQLGGVKQDNLLTIFPQRTYANSASTGGAVNVDNKFNAREAVVVYEPTTAISYTAPSFFRIENASTTFTPQMLLIKSASTKSSNTGLVIESGGIPASAFVDDTQSASPGCGKYQTSDSNNEYRIEGRNEACSSFTSFALFKSPFADQAGKITFFNGITDGNARLEVVGTSTVSTLFNLTSLQGASSGNIFTVKQNGKVGIGTTTPYAALSVVGSTGVVAGNFTATSTGSTFNGLTLTSGSNLTITGKADGCAQFATGVLTSTGSACGTSGGGITSLTAGLGLNGGTVTTNGTFSLKSYLATSSGETIGNLAYWTSTNGTPATLGKVATTSIGCSGFITCTGFAGLGAGSTITTTGTLGLSSGGTNAALSGANQLLFINAGGTAVTTSGSFTFDGSKLTTPQLSVTNATSTASFAVASTTRNYKKGVGFAVGTTTAFGSQVALYIASSSSQAATYTVNWNTGNIQKFLLNQSTKVIMNATSSHPISGGYGLEVCQDAVGSRTLTFADPTHLRWGISGTTTISSTPNTCTLIGFLFDPTAKPAGFSGSGMYYGIGSTTKLLAK